MSASTPSIQCTIGRPSLSTLTFRALAQVSPVTYDTMRLVYKRVQNYAEPTAETSLPCYGCDEDDDPYDDNRYSEAQPCILLRSILCFLKVDESEYLCDNEQSWYNILKPYAYFEEYDANPDVFGLNPVQMIEEAMGENEWGD